MTVTNSNPNFENDFYSAPEDKLFKQPEVKKILPFSDAWFERSRVYGGGIKFLRINRSVFYRKKDILDFINKHKSVGSTAEL